MDIVTILHICLTALPYLGIGWVFARDPTLDGFLAPRPGPGEFIASLTIGFAIAALFSMGLLFTGLILLFGGSPRGVLVGIVGGVTIGVLGQREG